MKYQTILLSVIIAIASILPVRAQTATDTNGITVTIPTPTQVLGKVAKDIESATNIAVAPYATYGLQNHKVGGGILALYNFNNYVGAGMGLDYFGDKFSIVSANVELKLPIRAAGVHGVH